MDDNINTTMVLKKVDSLERELARLKRDILHGLVFRKRSKKLKPSLFGSIRGGDITEEMIEESKHQLFRNLTDV